MTQVIAEFIGTFLLVFVGTGAIVVNDVTHGSLTSVGIALAFGAVVTLLIVLFARVSGAHFNPAITITLMRSRGFPWNTSMYYIAAQVAGAIVASLCLQMIFGKTSNLGAIVPNGGVAVSLVSEIVFTGIMVYAILRLSADEQPRVLKIALAVGAIITLEAFFGGQVSGASMNPARSIGPALISGNTGNLWLYVIAPVMGGYLAERAL